MKKLSEATTVLARTLAGEVFACGIEQSRILMVNRDTGQKSIVLVTTTDRATEMLLAFLDEQVESGACRSEDNGGAA